MARSAAKHATKERAASADRTQEELWAECIAAQPELIADIVTYIEAERTRLIESPPLSPDDAALADGEHPVAKPGKSRK
ncbi:MAG TPA: hypothetical protein VE909_00345 [Xanthobacteraceae bacterium]|nr:hypothetical protein [Xanthobacteraceae bacterium]